MKSKLIVICFSTIGFWWTNANLTLASSFLIAETPSQSLTACQDEATNYFSTSQSDIQLGNSIATGAGMYEVSLLVKSSNTNAICTVQGNVRFIQVEEESQSQPSALSEGAPAELQNACVEEAASYFQMSEEEIGSGSSRSTSAGMYEVDLFVGEEDGVCTVDRQGNVRFIQTQ